MKLLEIEENRQLAREECAALLHRLADSLARHNGLEFSREGIRYAIDVPNQIELEIELEIGDSSSLEIELRW